MQQGVVPLTLLGFMTKMVLCLCQGATRPCPVMDAPVPSGGAEARRVSASAMALGGGEERGGREGGGREGGGGGGGARSCEQQQWLVVGAREQEGASVHGFAWFRGGSKGPGPSTTAAAAYGTTQATPAATGSHIQIMLCNKLVTVCPYLGLLRRCVS